MSNIKDMYPTSIINNTESFKLKVMSDPNLNDMQKLKRVFDVSKEELKKHDPQLYYAILGVIHSSKCMKCAGLLPPSDYFTCTDAEYKEV